MRIGLILFLMVCILPCHKVYASETGTPSETSARIYEHMDKESGIAANVIQGSTFTILRMETDADGNNWYYVRTDFGAEGYIPEADVYKQAEEEALDESGQTDMHYIETRNNVNIREQPSTAASIAGRIPQNTVLEPLQVYENDNGEIWYQIEYDGSVGYIRDTTVNSISQSIQNTEAVRDSAESAGITETVQDETENSEGTESARNETESSEEESFREIKNAQETETEAAKQQAQTEKQDAETAANQETTRKWANPIDKTVILLVLGVLISGFAAGYIVKRIRKEQHA